MGSELRPGTAGPEIPTASGGSEGTPTLIADDVHVTYRVYASGRRLNEGEGPAGRTRMRGLREVHAVRGISFIAHEGETIGVVGGNGSGKSTLFRAMTGLLPTSQGKVWAKERPTLLGVNAALLPELSGERNIELGLLALGLTPAEVAAEKEEVAEFAGIAGFIHHPMRTYSSGMAARLKFAIASSRKHSILLVDEALNVGDKEFKAKSAERIRELREDAGTVMVVSHSMSTLRDMCTRVIWVDHGKVAADGDPEDVLRSFENKPRRTRSTHEERQIQVPSGQPPLRALTREHAELRVGAGASGFSVAMDGAGIRLFWRSGTRASSPTSSAVSDDGVKFTKPYPALRQSGATVNLVATNYHDELIGLGGLIDPNASMAHHDGLHTFRWGPSGFGDPQVLVRRGHDGLLDGIGTRGSSRMLVNPVSLVTSQHVGKDLLYVRHAAQPGQWQIQVAELSSLSKVGPFSTIVLEGVRPHENVLMPNFMELHGMLIGLLPVVTAQSSFIRVVHSSDGVHWVPFRDIFEAPVKLNRRGNPAPTFQLASGIVNSGTSPAVYLVRDAPATGSAATATRAPAPIVERFTFHRSDLLGTTQN